MIQALKKILKEYDIIFMLQKDYENIQIMSKSKQIKLLNFFSQHLNYKCSSVHILFLKSIYIYTKRMLQ